MYHWDPFQFKKLRKSHPFRLLFTAYARGEEIVSRIRFATYSIPHLYLHAAAEDIPVFSSAETAVTREQMGLLLRALAVTEQLGGCVVEVGAYRGVTTAILAARTKRRYFAVDPYIGYGGAEADRMALMERAGTISNVEHVQLTSGEAIRKLSDQSVSLVFIDAVHDYVNASFDARRWGSLVCKDGLIAFHDTDSKGFAGVQRVVWNLLRTSDRYELFGHVHGLTIVRKTANGNIR
jgi:predicted O-methyltransferase YrrM